MDEDNNYDADLYDCSRAVQIYPSFDKAKTYSSLRGRGVLVVGDEFRSAVILIIGFRARHIGPKYKCDIEGSPRLFVIS